MELIKDGWFSERSSLWPGQCLSLQVDEILHHEKSKYQEILIIETKCHGRTLILDGIIQCTERDEFAYQEMIAMLPLCSHRCPEKVLIVGGGDGGVAREVAKHPLVKHICQVEIDEKVIELSKRYLPWMSCGFDSPKLKLHIGDGFEYLKNHSGEFDVIITDSSDPVGPNESLFQDEYFRLLRSALKPEGTVCCQAGAPWVELDTIRKHMDACRKHFPVVKYAVTSVPTYPAGQIGLVIGSSKMDSTLNEPITGSDIPGMRYYNAAIHGASFVLPSFMQAALSD